MAGPPSSVLLNKSRNPHLLHGCPGIKLELGVVDKACEERSLGVVFLGFGFLLGSSFWFGGVVGVGDFGSAFASGVGKGVACAAKDGADGGESVIVLVPVPFRLTDTRGGGFVGACRLVVRVAVARAA